MAILLIAIPIYANGSTETTLPAEGNTYIDDLGREVAIESPERVSIMIAPLQMYGASQEAGNQ